MAPTRRKSPRVASTSPSSSISTAERKRKKPSPLRKSPAKKSPRKSPSPKKTSTSRKRINLSKSRSTSPPPILSSSYLENHSSKNDLVKRLREIVEELSDEDVEPNSPSYPGLEGLSSSLVSETYLEHKDKDVRLWTVLACMEIFYLYAPEPPWDESEILRIFSQMIRQLGNLAHCTSPSQANYQHYFRLLEQLSEVKIGCVLVEIAKGDGREEALEILCSLVHTLLDFIHVDHPSDVSSHVVSAVSSCIEEYDETIPIPLLDQILTFIADGQLTLVTNPAAVEAAARHFSAKKAGKTPSPHKPPDQISQTNCSYVAAANVLRRTENQLSTPVASLLNSLLNTNTDKSQLTREQVFCIIYELHRIAPNILTTVIGHVTNSLMSSDVTTRHLAVKLLGKLFQAPTSNIGTQFASCFREWKDRIYDVSPSIRMSVVKYLVLVLQNNKPREMRRIATSSLGELLHNDPDVEVRIQAIHDLCDLAYDDDGKDGVCIVVPSLLRSIGDKVKSKHKAERKDALTGLARIYHHRFIKEMTKDINDLDEEYFDADVCEVERSEEEEEDLNLSVPNHLHARYSWIPNIIVESACYTDSVDADMRNRLLQIMDDVILGSSLSEEQNAVGFALFVNSLSDNALKWLDTLWSSRYTLQKALESYLNTRAELKTCDKVQKVTMEAKVMQKLHAVANLTASSLSSDQLNQVLNGIHAFKDQHAFRLLSTISASTHSFQARQRALEDLPKRLSSLGSNATSYAKTLVRRVGMGTMNTTTFQNCLELAKASLKKKNIIATNVFLNSIEVLGGSFPPLIGCHATPLIELYEICTKRKGDGINEIQELLIDVFSIAAKANALSIDSIERKLKVSFQNELLGIVNKNGEPDQCHSAVLILGSMVGDNKALSSLVETLTENEFDVENERLDCAFISLSALIDCQSGIMNTKGIHDKFESIVNFAMDVISPNMENGSTGKAAKKKGKKKHSDEVEFSGEHKSNCISSALDFLVSYVRSVVMSSQNGNNKKSTVPTLSKEFISKLFCHISFLLSSKETEDVRLHAAIGLMRLSDSGLGLESKLVSTNLWYSLVDIFLDPSGNVREGTLAEWNAMMLGVDNYIHNEVQSAPALRFLALSTLVPDIGDHSKKYEPHHIGKYSQTLKATTLQCINSLRRLCEQTLAQCQAISREAENNFEKRYKMNIMPEFAVPFAFYLLVYRDETPTSDSVGDDEDEKRLTITKKRLKFLLEPLVTSLGDSADNISFLLRMVEVLGKYEPVAPHALHEDEVPVKLKSGPMEIKKLELLAKIAREVLLSFVKKDVNLTPYPSPIFIPGALFKRKSSRPSTDGSVNTSSVNDYSTAQISAKSPHIESAIKSSGRKSIGSSAEKSHVTFSQDVEDSPRLSSARSKRRSYSSVQDPPDWGDLSPLGSDPSPARPRRLLDSTSKVASTLTPIMDHSTPESSEATSSKVSDKRSNKKLPPRAPPTPASSKSSYKDDDSNSEMKEITLSRRASSKKSYKDDSDSEMAEIEKTPNKRVGSKVSDKRLNRKLPPRAPPAPASSKSSYKDDDSDSEMAEIEKTSNKRGGRRAPPKSSRKEDSELEDAKTSNKRGGRPPLKPKQTLSSNEKLSNKTTRHKRNATPLTEEDSEPVPSRPRKSPRSTLDDSSSKLTSDTVGSDNEDLPISKNKQKKSVVPSSSTSTKISKAGKIRINTSSNKIKVGSTGSKDSKTKIEIEEVKNKQMKKQTKRKKQVNDEFDFDDLDFTSTKKTKA